MVCNLFVVPHFEKHIVLVGLHKLKLPESKLVMANAQKARLNIFRLFQKIHQNVFGFVEGFLIAL